MMLKFKEENTCYRLLRFRSTSAEKAARLLWDGEYGSGSQG